MKHLLLIVLTSTSFVNAEISYKNLYTETGLLAGTIALAGYGFSRMCFYEKNKAWVQGIFCALAGSSGAAYYMTMHPESRMNVNKKSFKSAVNSDLFNLLSILELSENYSKDFIFNSLMRKISIYYVASRNPFYNAFEDMNSLKNQFKSVLDEAHLLLAFYKLDCYRNDSYRFVLEEQIELSQKAIQLITHALLFIKNTQEYKEAVNLQIQIEKQETLERIALAQQTHALTSCQPYRSTVIISG
ncbi:MAG: hypothetical protein K2X90_02800 [Candidatus Babeliaceae bacterium]|nr:hypothetical protein [Candidatus Babeliaceae bacterium]